MMTTTTGDPEGPSTVVNIPCVDMKEDEIHLLSRRLSFCPTPRHINEKELLDDLEGYFRRLRLKEFLMEEEDEKRNDLEMTWTSRSALLAYGYLPRVAMLPLKLT